MSNTIDTPPVLQRTQRSHFLKEVIETVALTLLIFLVIRFAIQNFRVEGQSMMNTLQDGQYVFVNKLSYTFHAPQRGDVIVFHFPVDPKQDFIKRIIGVPGDTVQITLDKVIVDGHTLDEHQYITSSYNSQVNTWTLQPDQYFVMGDNRGNSYDSRAWGPVPRNYIVGKATVVYWPLNNLEFIPTYQNVFKGISS